MKTKWYKLLNQCTFQSLIIIVFAVGCGSGSGGGSQPITDPGQGANATTENYGLIMGTVYDTAGTPLGGVSIKVGQKTTHSNEQGYFSLTELQEADRVVVYFTRQGLVDCTRITQVTKGESVFIEAVMSAVGKMESFDTVLGVKAYTANGASVEIGPNALVDSSGTTYTGTANIIMTAFDPTTPGGKACFPGEFTGVTISGESVYLESFGFMDVTLSDTQEIRCNWGRAVPPSS